MPYPILCCFCAPRLHLKKRCLWRFIMRIEQIIAVVARPVAIAIVREIKAVVSFVCDTRLHHLWLQRMPLGMPAYAYIPSGTSTWRGNTGGTICDMPGIKHGRLNCRPYRTSAFCPAGFEQA
jgi:hypothetical protein